MIIRCLKITSYRGLQNFEWCPSPGVNALIGPGDVGKTTVLAAISLLLSPNPIFSVSEYEYYRRRTDEGFKISAVIGDLNGEIIRRLPVESCLLGWKDNQLQGMPEEDEAEPVILANVEGTADLELKYYLQDAADGQVPFTLAARRACLLTQITGGARAMTEMRLGYGSLLERHIEGSLLRPIISRGLSDASKNFALPEESIKSLERIVEAFREHGLPDELHLGLITPQERSLLSLIGLLHGPTPEEAIPLAFSGVGTAQTAMFVLASKLNQGSSIVVVDEPEVGLEPYRQRWFIGQIERIAGANGQAFITTHSPAILSVLSSSQVTRLSANNRPITLSSDEMNRLMKEQPGTFLSRFPVLCEGDTETGLLSVVINNLAETEGINGIDSLGIQLVSRSGQPQILNEARALLEAGFTCGVFVDNENEYGGTRLQLKNDQRCAFGSWVQTRNIEEAIVRSISFEALEKLLTAATTKYKDERSLLQQVGQYINKPGVTSLRDLQKQFGEAAVRTAVEQAAQKCSWFKTIEGGRVLGRFLLEEEFPHEIRDVFTEFWAEIKRVIV